MLMTQLLETMVQVPWLKYSETRTDVIWVHQLFCSWELPIAHHLNLMTDLYLWKIIVASDCKQVIKDTCTSQSLKLPRSFMKEEDQMPVLITWFITLFFRPGPPLVARRTHDP
jgi:hypothetical protein